VVLFDLDGTLADTIPLIVASYQHAFRTVLAEEVEETRARAWIGRPLLPALLEESPEHGHELDRVYREWNLANTAALIRRYAGVPELLTELTAAGVTCAVATSKRRETARLALEGVGIDHLVEVAAALEDTSAHKPAPDPLLHAAASLGVEPGDCVYVGDATVDVLAARAAGMSAVAVTWGAGERDALLATGPDVLVDTVDDLRAYLLGRDDG
jgi:pyrophosphatase PpaX